MAKVQGYSTTTNSIEGEAFIALCRLLLIVAGSVIYFAITQRLKYNIFETMLFIAAFYYSLQMIFYIYLMDGKVSAGLMSFIDSLFLWLFFWSINEGSLLFMPLWLINSIFIILRFGLIGVLWGSLLNLSLYLIGILFFTVDHSSSELLLSFSFLVANSIIIGIIVHWKRKTDAKLFALYDIASIINSSLKLEVVLQETIHLVHRIVECQHCCILIIDKTINISLIASDTNRVVKEISIEESVRKKLLQEKHPYISDNNTNILLKDYLNMFPCRSLILIPIVVKDSVIGILHVDRSKSRRFRPEEIAMLTLVANQAGSAIENARLYQEMEERSKRDGLTGVYNHRIFQETLNFEFEKAKLFNHSLALVMVDVDDFKKFNDRFGHPMGDKLLTELALVLQENVRSNDLVARYGGEEFAIIMPQTESSQAYTVVERIRRILHNRLISNNINLTISAGIAAFPGNTFNKHQLIDKADKALYMAKERGRNRIEVAS